MEGNSDGLKTSSENDDTEISVPDSDIVSGDLQASNEETNENKSIEDGAFVSFFCIRTVVTKPTCQNIMTRNTFSSVVNVELCTLKKLTREITLKSHMSDHC